MISRSPQLALTALAFSGIALSGAMAADENRPLQQRTGPVRQPAAAGQPARPPQVATNLDGHFAACLVLSNDNEIAAAKFASQRTENAEVRKFAQSLERDHQQFAQELERFGKDELAASGGRLADRDADRPGGAAPGKLQSVANAPAGDLSGRFLQIKREMAEACRASTQRELDSRKGAEFDACFVGMQIAAHMVMVDELKVLERHASPELQPVLRKGREMAQSHFDEAKDLMKRLENHETASK